MLTRGHREWKRELTRQRVPRARSMRQTPADMLTSSAPLPASRSSSPARRATSVRSSRSSRSASALRFSVLQLSLNKLSSCDNDDRARQSALTARLSPSLRRSPFAPSGRHRARQSTVSFGPRVTSLGECGAPPAPERRQTDVTKVSPAIPPASSSGSTTRRPTLQSSTRLRQTERMVWAPSRPRE